MASAEGRLSREDYKKQQELNELRKSGAIEPERDEEGNEINPHIPQYMASAPWYLNQSGPSLKHQRNLKERTVIQGVAARSISASSKGKGVSRTRDEFGEKPSKKKTEAPRANGYDDTYEGKRDRWNGFDPQMYMKVMKRHDLLAKERAKHREQEVENSLQEGGKAQEKKAKQGSDSDSSSSDEEEEENIDADKAEMIDQEGKLLGQQIDEGRVGMQTRVSVRNLRIREDTAKYLRNLDVKSAYYDPKTRSMRSNPNPDKNPEELDYAGDNFVRHSGDTRKVAAQQLYEFEAYNRGQAVHMIGMPTQAEKLHQTFEEKKDDLVDRQKLELVEKYGTEGQSKQLPKALLYGQTEAYVEYAEDGSVLKGGEDKVILNSKYEEDKLVNNHTKIWGSFWYNGKWGYACCSQFIRNSYCTGETGRRVFEEGKGKRIGNSPLYETTSNMAAAMAKQVTKVQEQKKDPEEPKRIAMGERNEGLTLADFDKKKLKKALKEEQKKLDNQDRDDRKRTYNSMADVDVSQEEMEAYLLKKQRGDDPMMQKGDTRGYDFV